MGWDAATKWDDVGVTAGGKCTVVTLYLGQISFFSFIYNFFIEYS